MTDSEKFRLLATDIDRAHSQATDERELALAITDATSRAGMLCVRIGREGPPEQLKPLKGYAVLADLMKRQTPGQFGAMFRTFVARTLNFVGDGSLMSPADSGTLSNPAGEPLAALRRQATVYRNACLRLAELVGDDGAAERTQQSSPLNGLSAAAEAVLVALVGLPPEQQQFEQATKLVRQRSQKNGRDTKAGLVVCQPSVVG